MQVFELEGHSPWMYEVQPQLRGHVHARSLRAFAAGDAARDAIRDRAALEQRQKRVRASFIASLGGLPAMDTPLDAQVVGEERGDGFRVQKIIFQSRPKVYVTANLYLPDGISGRTGAVQFVCGHAREAKHWPQYQLVMHCLVKAGLVVLAQDPIGQGERVSYRERGLEAESTVEWGCPEHDYAGAQCLPLGDNIARYFLHDSMRGIDYLRSRPEVDPDRIGVTGNSGGGTQTAMMMLADPRIAAAAPGTFIMNRRTYLLCGGAQDAEQIWPGFSAEGFDHEDILLAMAPKPVRVLAVTYDFFPIEGTRETVARCRRLWELAGKPANLDLVEDQQIHNYTPKLAQASAAFFSRHLLGKEVVVDPASITTFPPQRLWCTPTGYVRDHFPDARAVHEHNRDRLAELQRARQQSGSRKAAVEWLRGRVMRDRTPCDLNPRIYGAYEHDDLSITASLWWSQADILGHGMLFRTHASASAGKTLPVTIAVWQDGTACLRPHLAWIRATCAAGRAVLVLNTSGVGALAAPNSTAPFGPLHKLCTDLIFLGDDLALMRTFDTLRALDMVAQWPGVSASDLRVYAHGREGIYGRLAAVLDQRIAACEVVDGTPSVADWVGARHYDAARIYDVVVSGLLKYADLSELEAVSGRAASGG
ncbi:MAG: prolyl oligopeptidase family serine peptidase [Planctomycetes bacterium]|nr:prolyl oligopeptidase family serine peptidase [Planctomycetota bacterium]